MLFSRYLSTKIILINLVKQQQILTTDSNYPLVNKRLKSKFDTRTARLCVLHVFVFYAATKGGQCRLAVTKAMILRWMSGITN